VFYNTGHGHLGWTLSAATAELVAESVLREWPGKPVQVAAAPSASMARSEALL
jgi:D-amino-acid dehydrogenase